MSEILTSKNVSKCFHISRNRPLTLRESFVQWVRGRNDPGSDLWALRNVSFSLWKGRALGIIGHNGAGKSTLLRLLCGLGRPTTGSIQRAGQVGSLLELGSGFHPDMTGRENLITAGILSGLRKRQVEAMQDEIIAFAELEKFIDQQVRTYSSGMYVRLAFSSAIKMNHDILVVDEILAVGDSRFQKKCIEQLIDFRTTGKTLVLASHDLEQIKSLCDEVLVLEEGRVEMQGDPENAIRCYHELMRQRTEKRAARISGETPTRMKVVQGDRLGTLEASIETVHLYNMMGKPVDSIQTGDSLVIELEYLLTPSVSDMAMLLGIYAETNMKCFEISIPSACDAFGMLSGQGTLRCQLSGLPLNPGRYYINLGLYPTDWSYTYDYHWQMHILHIEGRGGVALVRNVSGIVAIDPVWTVLTRN
jgi:lipopolysaccharide transport system ATP-binding protein